jgi:hypothetical protein
MITKPGAVYIFVKSCAPPALDAPTNDFGRAPDSVDLTADHAYRTRNHPVRNNEVENQT